MSGGSPRRCLRRLKRAMTRIGPRLAALLASLLVASTTLGAGTAAAAVAAVALQFEVQPGGGPSGRPMPQQPVIRVVAAAGSTVTSSTAAVTLRAWGTDAGTLICQENPVRAIGGVATFHGCYLIDRPRTDLRPRAT